MIRFITRQLLRSRILWFWPGLFMLFVAAIGIWGRVASVAKHGAFIVVLGPISVPGTVVIIESLAFVIFIGIIGFPRHFARNLAPPRASLIFSKSVSRAEFFFADFAAVLLVSVLYTLIMVIAIGILTGIEAHIFPIQFYLATLILVPLSMLAYYISIVFFIMVLNSRLAGAVVGYFVTGFSLFLLTGDEALTQMHIHSKIAHVAVHVLSYIIPSAAGIIKLMEQVYSQGFGAFQWGLLGFIIASCIPFFVISYYLVRRREF